MAVVHYVFYDLAITNRGSTTLCNVHLICIRILTLHMVSPYPDSNA